MNCPNEYFVSSTFAGEILSICAAKEVLRLLHSSADCRLDDLWESGARFLAKFNAINPGLVRIDGYPTRGVFVARDDLTLGLFLQECCLAGILFIKSWFYNWDLVKYEAEVIKTCAEVLGRIARGEVELKGSLPVSPFAAKVRGQ
jgi:hypothetical protein